MTPTTYTVAGHVYEPLTDYLRGWLPGALGLPCPKDPSPVIMEAWNTGARDYLLRERSTHGITNILWHACEQGACRKVEPCA